MVNTNVGIFNPSPVNNCVFGQGCGYVKYAVSMWPECPVLYECVQDRNLLLEFSVVGLRAICGVAVSLPIILHISIRQM